MIERFIAKKIMELCVNKKIKNFEDACSLGDQRCSFSQSWAEKTFELIKSNRFSDIKDDGNEVMVSEDFFKLCGFADYTDIDYNGKAKMDLDVGKPIPDNMHNKADLLYDGGVIEHVPDIFQAITNIMLMLKKGGIFIQTVPVSHIGVSYYTLDPYFYPSIFSSNGFDILECELQYYRSPKLFVWQNLPSFFRRYWVKRRVKKGRLLESDQDNKVIKYDKLKNLYHINQYNSVTEEKIMTSGGLPPNTRLMMIVVKNKDIDSVDDIISPHQDNYPRVTSSE